ncbi:hypothetical protein ACET3Z_026749 [Daucus carota]
MLIIYSFFGMLLEKGQKGGHCMMSKFQCKNSPAHDSSDHAVEARSIAVDVGGHRESINAREVICDIVKRLQSSNAAHTISHLKAMETELRDAEAARIEVSWLQPFLTKFREAQGKNPSVLDQMDSSLWLVSKAAERDLAAPQKWATESESCLRALAVVGKKFQDDMAHHEAKANEWRNPPNEQAKLRVLGMLD